MAETQTAAQRQLASYEEGFRAAGLPRLDEGFSASIDVFNRAAPLLALVFISEMGRDRPTRGVPRRGHGRVAGHVPGPRRVSAAAGP